MHEVASFVEKQFNPDMIIREDISFRSIIIYSLALS